MFWGLGNGGGTIIGGTLYHHYGPVITFRLFSVAAVFALISFVLAQYFVLRQRKSFDNPSYSSVDQVSRDRQSEVTSQKLDSLFDEEDVLFDADEYSPFKFLNKK